jgi:asparagine synthase (glutamine-hydrolysing)
MCGIAGGVFWTGPSRAAAEAATFAMVQCLAHRGPDGRGMYCSRMPDAPEAAPFVVFGHTRLAIIDTSDAGAQPMGRIGWVTYNGETYNFRELRRELEQAGARFHTRTDTEVLLRGYEAWGLDLLPRLRGMFAFALWDPSTKRVLLARDRLGIKPLYYYSGDGYLVFASEVRALLASNLVPRRLDRTAVWQYLGYQSIPAPRTLVEGVRALAPGHWLTVGLDGTQERRAYWQMLRPAPTQSADIAPVEAYQRTGELLRDAVAAHMVSDVPVGAFLSGGIDSSAVVALMREAGHQPRTFSIGFDESAFDESSHAALVARAFDADHTHVQLRADDLLEQLPAALEALDQPTGDGINSFIVSGAVRARGITVALSGLGGDELFGGYPSFARLARVADLTRIWGRTPDKLRTLAAGAVRAIGGSSIPVAKAAAVVESDGSISSMFPLTRQLLSVEQRRALINGALADGIDETDPYHGLLVDAYHAAPQAGVLAQISFAEARTYMHDVLLRDTDQMSMAHSLEVRVPLLDHVLVDHVMGLPDAIKQPNGVPKRLLVESLSGLLPDTIVRKPKQGFTLPFDPWMRGPLRAFCDERLGERGLAGREFLSPAEIRRMWQSFLDEGRDVSWSRLWALVVLDTWLERNPLSV